MRVLLGAAFVVRIPYFCSVITQIKVLGSVLIPAEIILSSALYFSFIKRSDWRVIVVLVINISVLTLAGGILLQPLISGRFNVFKMIIIAFRENF